MDARADRFPLVDSLRAIAALLIVGYHAAFFSGLLAAGSLGTRITTNLQVGVPIFFLISGFLLYRPFAAAHLSGEPLPRTRAYAWRRFLRIAPAYWVALTLAGVLGLALAMNASKLPSYYLFGQVYSGSTYFGGLPQAWTLCVEVTFYALLPLWALALRALPAASRATRLRQELWALALLFAVGVAYKLIVVFSADLNAGDTKPLLLSLPAYLDQFAVGMALAVVSLWLAERPVRPAAVTALDARSWLPWLFAGLAFCLAVALVGETGRFGHALTRTEYVLRHGLWTLCALAIMVPAVIGDREGGAVRGLLANRGLLFLGLFSYGIYLWHLTVMTAYGRLGLHAGGADGWFVWALLGGAGAIALGAASYYLVERPALRLKRLAPYRDADAAKDEAIAEPAPLTPSG
jgi:peptidoglycan/LPS O-acetylase OafA/YrhL